MFNFLSDIVNIDEGIESNYRDISLYHYSKVNLTEICPPVKIKGYNIDSPNWIGIMKHTISLFPAPIPVEKLLEMRNRGFKAYQDLENLYMYEIKLTDVLDKLIYFMYESKKEPMFEIIKQWDSEKQKILSQVPDITTIEFDFYKRAFKAAIYHKYNLVYASDISNDFVDMIQNAKSNWLEDIDYNIENGSKERYADFIPHFVVLTTGCIKTHKKYKVLED